MADRTTTVRLRVTDEFSSSIDRYSQKMNQAVGSTRQLENAGKSVTSGLRNLDSSFNTLFGGIAFGIGVSSVKALAENLYATGMNANRAEMLLGSFGAQIGNVDNLMTRLRGTTRGMVDDTTLMQAASTQLSMGLARNADDVNRLTNIGVTFAQAMGQDVKASMENLNLLLANQSYLRLDTLGISSSQVRELAGQYRAAGMDSSEAFSAAFMDVAEQKLPAMTAVAQASSTALQRMQVSFDNWWQDFGERFAEGVNALILIAEHGGEAIYRALFGWEPPKWIQTAETYAGTMGASDVPGYRGAEAGLGQSYYDLLSMNDQRLAARQLFEGGSISEDVYRSMVTDLARAAAALVAPLQQEMYDFSGTSFASLAQLQGTDVRGLLGGYGAGADDFAVAQAMAAVMQMQQGSMYQLNSYLGAGIADVNRYAAGQEADWLSAISMTGDWGQSEFTHLGALAGAGSSRGLFSADDAQRAQELYEHIAAVADELASMGADQEVIDQFDAMTAQAEAWRDAVVEGADRLENMNLQEILGAQGTGRVGEMVQLALQGLEGTMGDAELAALANRVALATGAETMASQSMEMGGDTQILLSTMMSELAPEVFAAALDRLDAELLAAGDEDRAPNIKAALGWYMSGTGGGFTAAPGDTVSALAAQAGMTVEQFSAMYGISNPNMLIAGQYYGGGGELTQYKPFATMEDAGISVDPTKQAQEFTDKLIEGADGFGQRMVEVFDRQYDMDLNVVVSSAGKDALNKWLMDQIKTAITSIVSGMGGVTPGSSSNTGRSMGSEGKKGG